MNIRYHSNGDITSVTVDGEPAGKIIGNPELQYDIMLDSGERIAHTRMLSSAKLVMESVLENEAKKCGK